MKKLVTFLVGLLITVSMVQSQNFWNHYLINEDFNGRQTLPEGWSFVNAATTAVFGRAAAISYVDGIRMAAAGSGNRGGEVKFPFTADSSVVYVEMDLLVARSTVNFRNTFQFYLLGSKSMNLNASDGSAFADVIAGVYWAGASGKFHLWNKDIKGPSPVDNPDLVVPVLATGEFPSFRRGALTNVETDSLNLSTRTLVNTAYNEWFNLKFVLNFTTKKIDLTITQISDPENSQTFTGLDFINKDATDFVSFGLFNNRASNAGNGANADLDATVDNFKVYQKVMSLGNADVTIKYQDTEGNTIKADRIAAEQEVGMEYTVLESDLTSIVAGDFYYSFDPAATGALSAMVESTGATIIVKFHKAPLTAGPYNWTGFVSDRWNEQDTNFSTDGVNQLGYQVNNTVIFNDAFAPIKDVVLDKRMEMGDGDVIFDAPGYRLNSTSGFLNGNGSVIVNASARLGFINNLTGPVVVNKDTLTLTNTQTAKRVEMKSGAYLSSTIGLNIPIVGDGGSFTLIPGVVAYTSPISNVSQVNYVLQARGNYTAHSGIPRMNNVIADTLALINVTTIAGDSSLFDTWANTGHLRINLGENVYMIHSDNPVAGGTTVRHIGELTGDAKSALVGNKVRIMTYHVGGLNTDATFHGKFIPFVRDAWDALTHYNLAKVGTGTWTLAGNSPDFFGSISVLDGTLKVDGVLCDMQGEYVFAAGNVAKIIPEIFVADTATLAGSGYLGANSVNVNGTITGSLTIGGSLLLAPDLGDGGATTIINVHGENIDKITVAGDMYYGGKLVVNVTKVPQPGTYTVFEFGSYIESGLFGFDSIELPSINWTFDYEAGTLTYAGGDDTSVDLINYNKTVDSIEYYDLTGRRVNREFDGIVFKRVRFTDGTSAVQKMLIKK